MCGSTLFIRGLAALGWELPTELAETFSAEARKKEKKDVTGLLAFDASDGSEISRYSYGSSLFGSAQVVWPRGSEKPVFILDASLVFDETGRQLFRLHNPRPNDFRVGQNRDTLFFASAGHAYATRFYRQYDGKIAYRTDWETNTVSRGDGSAGIGANAERVFIWHNVPEWGPHCPDTNALLTVWDAENGKLLSRIKPVMEGSREPYGGLLYRTPVFAGNYAYLPTPIYSASHPDKFGKISIVSVSGGNHAIITNEIESGTHAVPVFIGNRMFLRSDASMLCIHIQDEAGRKFQAQAVANSLLQNLGHNLKGSTAVTIQPEVTLKIDRNVPLSRLEDNLPTSYWLAAGPFKVAGNETALSALRPEQGFALKLEGEERPFSAIPRSHAYNDAPTYARHYSLQGTGDIVPTFNAFLDPTFCCDKDSYGFFYTVLENYQARTVAPAWNFKGITAWLNGVKLEREKSYLLTAGLYALLLRVEPGHFDRSIPLEHQRIDVQKALDANTLHPLVLSDTWKVAGALPPDLQPLDVDKLKSMPGATFTVDTTEYKVYELPMAEHFVYLNCLIGLQPGQPLVPILKRPPDQKMAIPHQAYCFNEIEMKQDGTVYLNVSADWFMRLYLNGSIVYDTLKNGNGRPPHELNTHALELKLNAGKHVLAILVRPGSQGWSFGCIGGIHHGDKSQLQEFRLKGEAAKAEEEFRIRPCFNLQVPPERQAQRWQARLREYKPLLQTIVTLMPDTAESQTAQMLLQDLKQ